MASKRWYELFPQRLVLEVIRVKSINQSVMLRRWRGESLFWDIKAVEVPQGTEVPALHFLVLYPEAFPTNSARDQDC